MIALLIILFIIECLGFCYLFYQNLEMNKDIDTLYEQYSKELEKMTKINMSIRRNLLR